MGMGVVPALSKTCHREWAGAALVLCWNGTASKPFSASNFHTRSGFWLMLTHFLELFNRFPDNPYPSNLGGEICPLNLGGGLSKKHLFYSAFEHLPLEFGG